MSRRRVATKRTINKDPKFHSQMVTKFINHVMLDGKKSLAERIVYDALMVAKKNHNEPIADKESEEDEGSSSAGSSGMHSIVMLLDQALENVRPVVEVKARRVGGATYQVPMEVRDSRRDTLAMRWLVQSARKRNEKGMVNRLAHEMLDALSNRGNAVEIRKRVHQMAKANQAFAHFR